MSLHAMIWVLGQDIRPSSIKFVLLALADHTGQNSEDSNLVWPSLEAICQKTSQDRKTVISALDHLERMRLLEDTGKRTGATGQVKVYRLVGLPNDSRHYTYKLTDPKTGEYYVGVRSCSVEPEKDDYYGSGKWPTSRKRGDLKKEVLASYPNRVEAEAAERQLIREISEDPLCQNLLCMGRTVLFQKESRSSQLTVPLLLVNGPENGTRNHKEPTKEPKKLDEPSAEALAFVAWFSRLLTETGAPPPRSTNGWARCYDKLLALDGKTKPEIVRVCEWARRDDFWRRNFLSPLKLRSNNRDGVPYYDVFLNQSKNDNPSDRKANSRGFENSNVTAYRELDGRMAAGGV
jgi:hypothetical protein